MSKRAFTTIVKKPKSALFNSSLLIAALVLLTSLNSNANNPELILTSTQMDEVQFAIPGNFIAPFDTLNNFPSTGLDLDEDGDIDIINPCSCRTGFPIPNGSNPNSGLFDDQIIIATGISNQDWVVGNAYGAFSNANFTPILPGTSIPEVGNTGVYVLPFIHQDAEGYSIEVQAPISYPSETFGPVVNTCYYPDPLIENIDNFYCDSEEDIIMIGSATSDFDNNTFPLTPESELWITSRDEDGQTFFGQTFSPTNFGDGHYTIRYSFDAGDDPHNNANKTGCTTTVEQEVVVRGQSTLACNGGISVVLGLNACEITITPEMLLASNFDNYESFVVEVVDPQGNSLGNVVPAEFANQPLPCSVTDLCNDAVCFSTVLIQDIHPPVITLPADTTLSCTTLPVTGITGNPTAEDCVGFTWSFSDEEEETTCGNPKVVISRTWVATDDFGNSSSAVQTININRADPADLIFPVDVDISCVDYNADPSIIDGTEQGAGQPNLINEPLCALAYTYTDNNLSICGGPTSSQLIIRTWLVLDICGTDYIEIDGNGEDNMQVIRVMDNTAPTVEADPFEIVADIAPQTNGLGACSSMGFIPPPTVSDVCSPTTEIRIFTPLGEATYLNGTDGVAGGFVPEPGLLLGTHTITYEVEDECGNVNTLDVDVTVMDNLPPVMICDNSLSLSLEASGFGRIYPTDIDEGSFDDCCEDVMKVKLETEPDSLFRDYLEFFCTNDTIDVVLRVYDCFGNFNDCSSSLIVEDRVPPVLVEGSLNTSMSCMGDYSDYLNADFEAPVFEDNCEFTVSFSYVEEFDECGLGTLTRTWIATDNPNNTPAIATQIITLEPTFDYRILVPDDVGVSCALLEYDDLTTNSENGCEQIEITVTEEPYVVVGDTINCYRILRTHQIINTCQYDGVSPPLELPRIDWIDLDSEPGDSYEVYSNGDTIFRLTPSGQGIFIGLANGFYQYQQVIDVFDNEPPVLSFAQPAAFCSLESVTGDQDPCSGAVTFPFTISDNCSDEFNIFYSLNAFNENNVTDIYGSLDTLEAGNFKIEGVYPVGSHSFFISVFDACGNLEQFSLPFDVVDCTVPNLTCVDVPNYNLQFDGTINFQPSDLVEFVGDNCSSTSISFSPDEPDMSRQYTCDSLGMRTLTVYARDESENQSSCTINFDIGDDLSSCIEFYNIVGNIKSEGDTRISEVIVNLEGPSPMSESTDSEGDYAFFEVIEGMGHSLIPQKNTMANNGLSTLDLILISQHILTVKLLDSPYKIIAADANKSGTITTLDIILFRQMILGLLSAFPTNSSWRFIPSGYEFSDPGNPFLDEFPETFIIEDLQSDTIINFIGIKVGDVNNSASGNMLTEIDDRTNPEACYIKLEETELVSGESFVVNFNLDQEGIKGHQFTLDFDPAYLHFEDFESLEGVAISNFGLQQKERGLISFSWDKSSGQELNTFEIRFRALNEGYLSEVLFLSSAITKAESYTLSNGNWDLMQPVLSFGETNSISDFELLQNRPNPFNGATEIPFVLPESSWVEISIFDVNNKQIYQREKYFENGLQVEAIEESIFPASGVYYYRVKIGKDAKVKKMIFIED